MLEIYNETIRDLLINNNNNNNNATKLEIRQTSDGNNSLPGLTEIQLTSIEQVSQLMLIGNNNRAVGSNNINEHSSRSHSIITIICKGKNKKDNSSTFGKLHLIDLAGSERISKTDATGDRLKEAQNINKSLSALGDVINSLCNKKATHIPYRNSKLTFLLQDSLGGNSKVLMFVNISPAQYNLNETCCSLTFATRCRNTELGLAKRQISQNNSGSNNNINELIDDSNIDINSITNSNSAASNINNNTITRPTLLSSVKPSIARPPIKK
jgi:kinesin family protein C2/C3